MEKDTRFYKLGIALKAARYGTSTVQVLRTCELVAQYEEEHTPDQVKEFQEEVSINPQVWARLLALHRDERLKRYQENLPCTYTTLYAIHRMSDEEVEAAVQQGVIHSGASSHSILSWCKQNRLYRAETLPPWRCLVIFENQLNALEFARMRFEMRQVALNYGARLISEEDYIQAEPKEIGANLKRIQELQGKIKELTAPLFASMNKRGISKLGVCNLDEFIHVSLRSIGPLLRIETGTDAPRFTYPPEYIFRIALEYLKTDSRQQRYNCKRRLKQLAEKQPDLKDLIDEVLETYMK